MRIHFKFVVFFVFLVNVCRALTTVKSTKTLPNTLNTITRTSSSISKYVTSTKKVNMYTTLVSSNNVVREVVVPDYVAKVTMKCYPPKGLSGLRKRDGQTTKVVSVSKTLQGESVIPFTPPPKTVKTCDLLCTISKAVSQVQNQQTLEDYSIYTRFGVETLCNVFTLKYPITTVMTATTTTTNYGYFGTRKTYPALVGTKSTTTAFYETTSFGFKELNDYITYTTVLTNRYQTISPSITCITTEKVTELPYISTKKYDSPITSQDKKFPSTSVIRTEEYIMLTSVGTIPVTYCRSAKQIPNTVTTTTTSTKQLPVITTTTTTSTTKQPPVITTTTTTSTTKQPPVITTTTTTSTTKQPPVITSTTTTSTTKQPPITTTTPTTKCLPITLTVTEKEKVTVTEKVTVYVTVKSEPTHTNNANCAKKWAQCGGVGFNGPTCCESGSVCKELNNYYSQCI